MVENKGKLIQCMNKVYTIKTASLFIEDRIRWKQMLFFMIEMLNSCRT
jgi:hypothetical protein